LKVSCLPASVVHNTFHSSGSPTAELFRCYFSKLAAAILYPERLANELYSKNVVSAGVRDEMNVIGQSSYHKTTRLLAAVECKIKENPGSLHTFLSILREDPSLVYIADAMSDEYRKFVLLYILCSSTAGSCWQAAHYIVPLALDEPGV